MLLKQPTTHAIVLSQAPTPATEMFLLQPESQQDVDDTDWY